MLANMNSITNDIYLHLHLVKSVKIVRYHTSCKNLNETNTMGC